MNITTDMTPLEAANLLAKLEEGHLAAWRSTRETPWHSAEYQARFHNAAEVDGVLRDILRETAENGMCRPGEPAEEFAERAGSQAWLADARRADVGTPDDPLIQPTGAGTAPDRPAERRNELTARLLSDARTPESQAYGRAFSDTAAAYVRDLRERDPLPEPDRMPGAPHPDSFLAGRGWQVSEHGIYTRGAKPQPQAPPERELEAGS